MKHSIPAGSVAWTAASIGGASARGRERRLGLRPVLTFQRAATRRILVRASHGGLKGTAWIPARVAGARSGLVRPAVVYRWAGAGRPQADRRSATAAAPWRG